MTNGNEKMTNLITKNNLTKNEYEELDYYFDKNIEKLVNLENKIIINFIEECDKTLGYSLAKIELEHHIFNEASDGKFFFEENKIDYYNKIIELANHFSFWDCGLPYVIGDYYYTNQNKDKALNYYKNIFKKGFNLCDEGYFDSLINYLRLLDKNPSDELKELINFSPLDNEYSLDFINTYLLLIINLEKFSEEYLY